jgi:serine/threonine protein kinase
MHLSGAFAPPLERAQRQQRAANAPGQPPKDGPAIGPWRLTRLIHRTPHTVIYRARPVTDWAGPGGYAVKTIAAAATDWGRTMLRREATVAREAAHPHLVSSLAEEHTVAQPFLVLPYLEGVTLRRRLEGGGKDGDGVFPLMPIATALWIVRQAAEALAALHAAGWLHGQVRPEHLVISPQGHATLIDLTQCRGLQTAECLPDGGLPVAAAYAPPEAFAHRGQWSAASDTYSLGVVLFEALAGQRPFAAPDPRRLAALHRGAAPPDVRQIRYDAPREVGELVRRMLAKQPLRRPSDEELVRWLAELEIAELVSGASV